MKRSGVDGNRRGGCRCIRGSESGGWIQIFLIPISARRNTDVASKHAREVGRIIESDGIGDVQNTGPGIPQQNRRLIDPKLYQK
ncbi:MAG: hypothetical protein OEM83_05305, partial [Gammaproteobacteria bacterium]|nr:hypothetical protein [Gammaproteobacteria bacterium]